MVRRVLIDMAGFEIECGERMEVDNVKPVDSVFPAGDDVLLLASGLQEQCSHRDERTR